MMFNQKKPKLKQVMSTCSWCGQKLQNDDPIYALGCKKRPGVDISAYEGKVMSVKVTTSSKTLWSIVPMAGSDARQHGKDFLFTLCSEKCGDELKELLDVERDLGELILSAEHIY